MIENSEIRLTSRTRVQYGIELPWERKERYGSELRYPKGHAREGQQMYPDRQPTGTVIESGTVFIPLSMLEELQEADHSLGMGGAYIEPDPQQGLALEKAGLASQETRGGYYTTEEHRKALSTVVDALWEQHMALPKGDDQ